MNYLAWKRTKVHKNLKNCLKYALLVMGYGFGISTCGFLVVANGKKLKANICFMYFLQGLTFSPQLKILWKNYSGNIRYMVIFGKSNFTLIAHLGEENPVHMIYDSVNFIN